MRIKIRDRAIWVLIKKEIQPDGSLEKWYGVGFGLIGLILFYLIAVVILYLKG